MKKPEIFPQTKRKNITFDFDTYNFSSIGRELTEDELYIVNGGKQIENSDEAVANAQIGDTLTRKDGTVITINQGDIDYAKKQIAGSTNSNGSPVSSNTGAASGNDTETSHVNTETAQNNTPVEQTDRDHSGSNSSAGSSQLSSSGTGTGYSTQSSSSSGNSNSNGSSSNNPKIYYLDNTSAKVDEENETISFEKSDPKGAERAFDAFYIRCDWGYTLNIFDKGVLVDSFDNSKDAYQYITKLEGTDIEDSKKKQNNDVAFSFGFGSKVALILGIGVEAGVVADTSNNWYLYFSGSLGCGIETPFMTKTDLSTKQYLNKALGIKDSFILDPTKVGYNVSKTADICLGVVGTYDLENQNESGIPNSFSFGSVGGGVWKTGTLILPINKN